jgi:hypothetical protein
MQVLIMHAVVDVEINLNMQGNENNMHVSGYAGGGGNNARTTSIEISIQASKEKMVG